MRQHLEAGLIGSLHIASVAVLHGQGELLSMAWTLMHWISVTERISLETRDSSCDRHSVEDAYSQDCMSSNVPAPGYLNY